MLLCCGGAARRAATCSPAQPPLAPPAWHPRAPWPHGRRCRAAPLRRPGLAAKRPPAPCARQGRPPAAAVVHEQGGAGTAFAVDGVAAAAVACLCLLLLQLLMLPSLLLQPGHAGMRCTSSCMHRLPGVSRTCISSTGLCCTCMSANGCAARA